MSSRITALLFILTLALGGYLFFIDRQQPTPEESALIARRVFSIQGGEVQRFRIYRDYWTDIICERRDDDTWMLIKPYETRADDAAVQRLLSTLEFLEYVSQVELEEDMRLNLQRYGLQDPVLSLTIETAETMQTLLLGHETPLGDGIYALLQNSEEKLFVLPSRLLPLLDRDADSWVYQGVQD